MSAKVAILGHGPAAGYASLACKHRGIIPAVFSPQTSLPTKGAFFYHRTPGAEKEGIYPVSISVVGIGESDRYFEKQWGHPGESTFPTKPYTDYGYNPQEVWDYLWDGVPLTEVNKLSDFDVAELANDYDFVFQTFPTDRSRAALGKYKETYPVATISVRSMRTFRLIHDMWIEPNTVIYDGTVEHPFVRVSLLFGHMTREYPIGYNSSNIEYPSSMSNVPDLRPECPRWPREDTPAKNVHLVGRWATWNRHELANEAYDTVNEVLG